MASLPVDFKARRSIHQTLRDRKQLKKSENDVVAYEKRVLRTEYVGGYILGAIHCGCLLAFFWLLSRWVEVGGAS
jgi:hypothetical protein